jgi:hypothetical protein
VSALIVSVATGSFLLETLVPGWDTCRYF